MCGCVSVGVCHCGCVSVVCEHVCVMCVCVYVWGVQVYMGVM